MAKQEIRATPVVPNGTLDFNTHADDIKEGNLTASLNTRVQNNEYETIGARQNIKGTRFAFVPDAVNAQNKRFRFNFNTEDFSPMGFSNFDLYSPNNTFILNVQYGESDADITNAINRFIANVPVDFAAASNTLTIIGSAVTGTYTGYVDIEVTTVSYWDYNIIISDLLNPNTRIIRTVTVIQEAIDASAAGNLIALPTKDLLGDLFCLYTTKQSIGSTIEIVGGTNNGSGLYLIETAEPYNLLNNSEVRITGTLTDGEWIIQPVTATTFTLTGSTYTADFTGGTLYINQKSISEIGVAQHNVNTDAWTYTRLLRTSQWNLRADRQPEIGHAEDNIFRKSIYFNDWYNPDRVFYYVGEYIQDGALIVNNPNGLYDANTVGQETQLIIGDKGIKIEFTSQDVAGGALLSGTYIYSGYMVASAGGTTIPLQVTGQIPVYVPNQTGVPSQIGGSVGALSSKQNNLTITFPANLYDEFHLIAVYSTGGSVSATEVATFLISQDQTTLNVTHKGNETTVKDYDVGLLSQKNTIFNISRTLRAIKNRLTRSNLKSTNTYDLSAWARTFLHDIKVRDISPDIGSFTSGTLAYGDYQVPENVCYFGGSRLFECYRYALKVEWKSGGISDAFWIDDILIDGNTYNIDPAYPDDRRDGNDLNGQPYQLRNPTTGDTRVIYIDFHGYDRNFLIDGIPVSNLINRMWIVRAEVVQEVLGSGFVVMGVSGIGIGDGTFPSTGFPKITYNTLAGSQIGMFPYFSGHTLNTYYDNGATPFTILDSDNIPYSTASQNFVAERRYAFYYDMDYYSGQSNFRPLAGDRIRSFGNSPMNSFQAVTSTAGSPKFQSNYVEHYGRSAALYTNYIEREVEEGFVLEAGEINHTVVTTGLDVSNLLYSQNSNGSNWTWWNLTNMLLYLDADLNDNGGSADYGTYQVYYYRGISTYDADYNPDTSKYGLREETRYPYLLTEVNYDDISDTTPVGELEVFTNHVYTNTYWMKPRHTYSNAQGSDPDNIGFTAGIKMYSQTITNSSLIVKDGSAFSQWAFPNLNISDWLFKRIDESYLAIQYDRSYNYIQSPTSSIAYNTRIPTITSLPATVNYSDVKVLNSFNDPFRIFKPLNNAESPLTYGQITTHEIVNEQLFVYQQRNFERKQFNTQGELITLDNAAVIVGGGGVLPDWGQRISNIGCEHKWSVVVGRSKGGNDVAYWVNQELGAVVRFGYDGTVPISEVHLIDPFIQEQLRFLKGKDSPLSGQGICAVWNNVNKEYIITVRGRKEVAAWDSSENYTVGNEVFYQPSTYSTYEQTGEIYIALQDNTNSNPESNPEDWSLVPHTNPLYYNEYTLVFSEIQNGFSGFRTFKPKVYSQWTKTYLSANPINNLGQWYEHEKGEYCRFYESQEEQGYDEFIINTPTFTRKLYGVIRMQTLITPVRVDFRTQHYQSYLEASDFTFRDGIYDSPIKYDSTVSGDNPSGLNSLETAKLHDDWLKVKLFYDIGELQYINGFVVKFKLKPRLYTQ